MSQDIFRSGISALGRIKRLAPQLLRSDGQRVGDGGDGAAMRQARRRLASRRSADARAVVFARQFAAPRVERAPAATCDAPVRPAARAATAEFRPQLDAAAIGRHCRQIFPAAPADGRFDDLLARLETCEWRGSGPPLPPSAPDIASACAI